MNIFKKSVAIFVATFALVIAPTVASAVEYGGFGGRPAFPRSDNSRSQSIFVHTLEPGDVQAEGVRVINNANVTKTFLVYGADSAKSTDGGFACEQRSDTKDGVGSWLSLDSLEVTLESGTNEIIPFDIIVPDNASVGEHNGCILIQEIKPPVEGQTGAIISVRTGLRIAITVPGEIVKSLEIKDLTVERKESGDSFIIHPVVENTGNVSIDTNVSAVTRSVFGRQVAEHGGEYPVLRGDTSEWNFELGRPMLGGFYKTSVSISYNDDPASAVGENDELNKVIDGPTVSFFALPTVTGAIIEIVVLAIIILLIVLMVLKRKRAKWIKNEWVAHTVNEGDTVNSLAAAHGISWKLLVHANDMKPPYSIAQGETIKVPPAK